MITNTSTYDVIPYMFNIQILLLAKDYWKSIKFK